jgi:DNA-directed RNA polymerase specialized sigma24 family protein
MYESARQDRREKVRVLAEDLYRDRRPLLLAIARHHSDAGVDVEAAVHDAFTSFLEHYRPETAESAPLPWLVLTLKRRCWSLYGRQRSGRERLESAAREAVAAVPPTDPIEALTRAERTRIGLTRLKPAERRALSLLAFGYSYLEIMAATGWTYTKVNRSIREGRVTLRRGSRASSPI